MSALGRKQTLVLLRVEQTVVIKSCGQRWVRQPMPRGTYRRERSSAPLEQFRECVRQIL